MNSARAHGDGMTRRAWLSAAAGGVAAAVSGATWGADNGEATRPNIIVILADDMGYSDLGCYGGEIATPNVDRLAAKGLRFRQFYNGARCCPTRASLLTGLYAHQVGVGHMADWEFDYGVPGYTGALNRNGVSIGEALRRGGYRTLMSGKWHVAMERGNWPHDRGFDEFYGIVHGAANYFDVGEFSMLARNNDLIEGDEPDGFYITDAFTDHAIDFIEDAAAKNDKPYFLYLAYTAPHFPLHAKPEDIEKYRDAYTIGWDEVRRRRLERQHSMGLFSNEVELTPRGRHVPRWEDVTDKETWALRMAVYAAMVDSMDQNIGRLLDAVEATGEADNTLIMFMSDNGGCSEPLHLTLDVPPGPAESFHTYDAPWANASNTPFREYKRWVHEGGIRTPFIAHWPAAIPKSLQGSVVDEIGHVMDVMATCLDVAGIEYPQEYEGNAILPLEGKSLAATMRGAQREGHAALFWEHEGNRAVRRGRWKLVSYFSDWGTTLSLDEVTWASNEWELYDMERDPVELANVAQAHPDVVRDMSAMYWDWARSHFVEPWEDLLPIYRANQVKRQAAEAAKASGG